MTDFLSFLIDVMAVSKFQSAESIQVAIDQGYRLFGENRVQEAMAKWPALLSTNPTCRLHLIGPLQTNKVKDALTLFHGIESVDRPKLVDEIHKNRLNSHTRTTEFLIQVNVGCEPQKAGVMPDDLPYLIEYCQEKDVPISGLMCIPPVDENPEPYFLFLTNQARQNGMSIISMGMSGDYETAIKCGSTRIRVGTAIFGPRPLK